MAQRWLRFIDAHRRIRLFVRRPKCFIIEMRPNQALQRTRPSRSGCSSTPSWTRSLSLGRSANVCVNRWLLFRVSVTVIRPGGVRWRYLVRCYCDEWRAASMGSE